MAYTQKEREEEYEELKTRRKMYIKTILLLKEKNMSEEIIGFLQDEVAILELEIADHPIYIKRGNIGAPYLKKIK